MTTLASNLGTLVIYFAGHGSEVPKSQCISEMAPKIQMIIPHDFNPRATQPEAGQGILDYYFSDWLAKVANVKGDNIVSSGH